MYIRNHPVFWLVGSPKTILGAFYPARTTWLAQPQQCHSPRAQSSVPQHPWLLWKPSAASPAHQDGFPASWDAWALPPHLLQPSCSLFCFSDLHWLCAGVCEPLQGTGNLHQAEHGAVPRRQLLWSFSSPVSGPQGRFCHSHTAGTRGKRQTGLYPCPSCSPGNPRAGEDPLEGVVWGSFYSCSSLQRGWVAFARAVFGKGVGSFLAAGTELPTQPWQDRSSLFQGYLGSLCPGLSRGKSFCCVGVSFLPLLLLPDQYLSGISLVAKIPSACWNKECIYLHGLAWWAFPISHWKKKKVWGLKLFLKAFEFFCQAERKRWVRAEATWLQNGVFFRTKSQILSISRMIFMLCYVLLGFFLRHLGRVNDLIFEQTIWVVSYCWHIAQESKQTRMCWKHREGEKHHYLGKSQCLKLDLLGQKCDFYCLNPDGGEWNLKNPAFKPAPFTLPVVREGLQCPWMWILGLCKILGAVALF